MLHRGQGGQLLWLVIATETVEPNPRGLNSRLKILIEPNLPSHWLSQ